MPHIPDVGTVITTLTISAGFSLFIERVIETFKMIIHASSVSSVDSVIVTARQQKNKSLLGSLERLARAIEDYEKNPENLAGFTLLKSKTEAKLPVLFSGDSLCDGDMQKDESFENTPFIILKELGQPSPQDLIDKKLRLFFLLSAFSIGIIIAESMDIHMLSLLMGKEFASIGTLDIMLDTVLSGLVIAGGSHPIHILLEYITTRKVPALVHAINERSDKVTSDSVLLSQTVAYSSAQLHSSKMEANQFVSNKIKPYQLEINQTDFSKTFLAEDSPAVWVPIPYQGGIRPDQLESSHLRVKNPDRVVYHHTAMPSQLGFDAIVDEFILSKKWKTGYHVVVMPNGALRSFCRWDRVGNHTKGVNNTSLGIAFHGNFHSDPIDDYSNHDGRFDNRVPTQAQLLAGARMVALWIHLYDDILLNFDRSILAHKNATPGCTVCPGSHFPYDEFESKVTLFYQQWQQSRTVQQQIMLFKTKPYLYV